MDHAPPRGCHTSVRHRSGFGKGPQSTATKRLLCRTATNPSTEEAAVLQDASGTWQVNTDIGTFDFADATSTFAGLRVAEELRNLGATEAVAAPLRSTAS